MSAIDVVWRVPAAPGWSLVSRNEEPTRSWNAPTSTLRAASNSPRCGIATSIDRADSSGGSPNISRASSPTRCPIRGVDWSFAATCADPASAANTAADAHLAGSTHDGGTDLPSGRRARDPRSHVGRPRPTSGRDAPSPCRRRRPRRGRRRHRPRCRSGPGGARPRSPWRTPSTASWSATTEISPWLRPVAGEVPRR